MLARRHLPALLAVLVAGMLFLSGAASPRAAEPAELPDLAAACAEANAFVATVCYPVPDFGWIPNTPSVVMLRDTADDWPHYLLAEQREVGSVYGLAYSHGEPALYAAAFRKRTMPLGSGGLGAIYRIDLRTGAVRVFATVPNVAASEPIVLGDDLRGLREAGKTGLGDLDLNDAESELYAVNLFDRRIYRYELATGRLLGSFAHGAAAEAWVEDARPFGLGYTGGRLFHGVVNSAESSRRRRDLQAIIYSSQADGTDLRRVASFGLDYPRGTLTAPNMPPATAAWQPWRDSLPEAKDPYKPVVTEPMPLVSDIVLDEAGDLAIGLRDRAADMGRIFGMGAGRNQVAVLGVGDLLRGTAGDGQWAVSPVPDHYDDAFDWGDESNLGGIAVLRNGDRIVSASLTRQTSFLFVQPGLTWYDRQTGGKVAREVACQFPTRSPIRPWTALADQLGALWPLRVPPARADNEGPQPGQMGDVEALCGPPAAATPTSSASPAPTATATVTVGSRATPTATPTVTPSPTAVPTRTATSTATRIPVPAYLPILLKESCTPTQRRVDAALVLDASSSMLDPTAAGRTKLAAAVDAARAFLAAIHLDAGDQAALVAFNADAWLVSPLTTDRTALDAGLAGLTTAQFTRIDRGIAVAREELAGSRRRSDNVPVMIVLTDGLANPVPVDVAVAEAARAKDAGVVVFTVGLGQDVDVPALAAMASRPEYAYLAPDAEALAGIYRAIAVTIPCPPEAWWGRR